MKKQSVSLTGNEKKILLALNKNGAESNGALAKKLRIHHTTVLRIKKSLEQKLGLKYTVSFDPLKIPSYKVYYILQQLVPGARDNEEVERKMAEYYRSRRHIIGYGKCIHGKWDSFTIFYCSEEDFDAYFNEFKSRTNMMTEEMDIIKTTQDRHQSFMHLPVDAVF